MKRQLSNSGVAFTLSLLFMLGGLFIANDVHAQANTVMQTQQPVTIWISPQQALAVASAEFENLTAKLLQMKDNGLEKSAMHKTKAELRLYKLIIKSLESGSTTKEAFDSAWNAIGIATDAGSPYFTAAEAEALRKSVLAKLTD